MHLILNRSIGVLSSILIKAFGIQRNSEYEINTHHKKKITESHHRCKLSMKVVSLVSWTEVQRSSIIYVFRLSQTPHLHRNKVIFVVYFWKLSDHVVTCKKNHRMTSVSITLLHVFYRRHFQSELDFKQEVYILTNQKFIWIQVSLFFLTSSYNIFECYNPLHSLHHCCRYCLWLCQLKSVF